MPFKVDDEVWDLMAPIRQAITNAPNLEVGDIKGMRKAFEFLLPTNRVLAEGVEIKDFYTKTSDGYEMLLRWYNPKSQESCVSRPAVFFMHGGGMVFCNVRDYDPLVSQYAADSGVPVLSVEFRSAPENAHPGMINDNYHGLTWMRDNAAVLKIDPSRIAIMGDSGGGGLCAALGIYARDQKFSPPIAKMVLIYPMLDDRTTKEDPDLEPFIPTWSSGVNSLAWGLVLGHDAKTGIGGSDVSEYAAPARLKEFSGLPPTYIDVGELDIFRNEDIEFARKLWESGVSCELHVYTGVVHGFDGYAPGSKAEKLARVNRIRALQSF